MQAKFTIAPTWNRLSAGEPIDQHRGPVGDQHRIDEEIAARAVACAALRTQELDQPDTDAQHRHDGMDRTCRGMDETC
ncbi:hypothetical protein H8B02_43375 [Bradyrhizobium sp. Pear77]|uniref:hypothetical protein n=1 Tax=Bradyrhizobium altum TaxID=1571202 RepID=UPI001E5E47F9|nr:hypothetical protein [Bradyrhizobium altum]MCC8960010.1 hypothetical protein [Bradyrhizobium altum]